MHKTLLWTSCRFVSWEDCVCIPDCLPTTKALLSDQFSPSYLEFASNGDLCCHLASFKAMLESAGAALAGESKKGCGCAKAFKSLHALPSSHSASACVFMFAYSDFSFFFFYYYFNLFIFSPYFIFFLLYLFVSGWMVVCLYVFG